MTLSDPAPLRVSLGSSVAEVDATLWDACANPGGGRAADPFTSHRFLSALERSGSIGGGTGWAPRPVLVHAGEALVAVAPLYVKSHSQGEYIFDHAWADAWRRAGGSYYPKLQLAVPFTPATGRRFLTLPGWEAQGRAAILQGLEAVAAQNGLSSAHVTFLTAEEAADPPPGWLSRVTTQFHWENQGYASYNDFLAALSSRKRKALRKERAAANAFGGEIELLTGEDLRPEHWAAFWDFYQDTGARKWGRPYLTRAFFDELQAGMRADVLLILARREGRYVAGALNFLGRDTVYGRYWGCLEDHPFLHFELCYHRAIDWAVAHGLSRVEAGAQGEHKLARGYLPVAIHSLHHMAEPGFQRAVAQYLEAERAEIAEDIEVMTSYGPFRAHRGDEHE